MQVCGYSSSSKTVLVMKHICLNKSLPHMVILKSISRPHGVSETVSIDRLKPLSTVNVTGIGQRRETNDVFTVWESNAL